MSGIDTSAPAANARAPDPADLVNFSGHVLPGPQRAGAAHRTARGRRLMLIVLLVCVAPVVASYLTYFFIRPQGRTNYSDLISPTRPVPTALALKDLRGGAIAPASLRGQWLLVVVSHGTCDARCERLLWLQRQLHETLGKEKERVDKLWLVDDAVMPRSETLAAAIAAPPQGASAAAAVAGFATAQVLVADRSQLSGWLEPAVGQSLEDHLYIVDPQGDWMMRAPADPDPARLKRDVEKLLRASAGWDRPGR